MNDLISRQAAIDALEWKWAGKEEKTMNEELKPCPFCGGNNLSVEGITFYWVECTDCNASIAGNETKEEAVEAWNRRAYVEPERKQGKWIAHYSDEDGERDGVHCSECKTHFYFGGQLMHFCPNCGADMRGEE